MSIKKAIVCSIMLSAILIVSWIAAHLVPPSPTGAELGPFITYCLAGLGLSEIIKKFYRWLMKEDK